MIYIPLNLPTRVYFKITYICPNCFVTSWVSLKSLIWKLLILLINWNRWLLNLSAFRFQPSLISSSRLIKWFNFPRNTNQSEYGFLTELQANYKKYFTLFRKSRDDAYFEFNWILSFPVPLFKHKKCTLHSKHENAYCVILLLGWYEQEKIFKGLISPIFYFPSVLEGTSHMIYSDLLFNWHISAAVQSESEFNPLRKWKFVYCLFRANAIKVLFV